MLGWAVVIAQLQGFLEDTFSAKIPFGEPGHIADCSDIFDRNEFIDFVGGKAKGVKLGRYTPTSKIQFIGCRGDAQGKKIEHVEITHRAPDAPVGAPRRIYVESC